MCVLIELICTGIPCAGLHNDKSQSNDNRRAPKMSNVAFCVVFRANGDKKLDNFVEC